MNNAVALEAQQTPVTSVWLSYSCHISVLHPRLFLFTARHPHKLSDFPHAIHIFFLAAYEKISSTFFLKFEGY